VNGSPARPARFAILADDLTGALDCAAAFITPGSFPYVAISADTSDAPQDSPVVSINADTRRLHIEVAAGVVRQSLAGLETAGGAVRYVKIDSTLRGHPGLEISLCAEVSGSKLVLVCPAFPDTGRIVRDGNLLVHGVPLHETEVGRDPLSPLESSNVSEILRRDTGLPVTELRLQDVRSDGFAASLSRLVQSGGDSPVLVTCDAVCDADLDRIVASGFTVDAASGSEPRAMFAGSAGLAFALARLSQGSPIHNAKIPAAEVRAPLLIVTASQRSLADRQIAVLESAGLVYRRNVDFLVASDGAAHINPTDAKAIESDLDAGRSIALRAMIRDDLALLHAETVRKVADDVTSQLGQLIRQLAGRRTFGGIVIVGGDTAYGVLTATGARGIVLHAEPLPGVPVGTISGGTLDGTVIATKAGAFGDDQTLLKLANYLLAGGEKT
jgi:uncharacterized protein YgbK (DUF1537 family)